MQIKFLPAFVGVAMGLSLFLASSQAALILSDDFTVSSNANNNANFEISNGRQSGSSAPSTYTNVTTPSGVGIQLGNSGTRVGQVGGASNKDYLLLAYANSLQNDLVIDAALANGLPVTISFHLYTGSNLNMDKWIAHRFVEQNIDPGTDKWIAFTLAQSGQTWPIVGSGQFGFLVRQNGEANFFNNGQVYDSLSTASVVRSYWTVTFSDPSGMGSPFTSAGTRVVAMNGSTIVSDQILSSGFGALGSLRLGFRAYTGLIGGVDNLKVSTGTPIAAEQTYNLVARHSRYYLDASGAGTANGTPIIQSVPHGGTNQQWTLSALGNGQYNLTGLASGRSIQVSGASQSDNAAVELYDWQSGNNQKFTLKSQGNGYYSLLFVHSGKAMTVQNGSTASGAAVVQYTDSDATEAQWKFVKAPSGYLFYADEGDTVTIPSGNKIDIAYGADGKFNFVNGVDGDWTFRGNFLGDPIPGVVKSVYYKTPVTGGPGDGYTRCASENGTFTFTQPVDVAYGANGQFSYLTGVTGTITFNNATFGDPIHNTVKSGYFKVLPPTPPTFPPLSQANLNDFIANHSEYEGGSSAAWFAEFTEFLQLEGGDVYYERLSFNWPNFFLDITSSYTGAAASNAGSTDFNKSLWDNDSLESRVAVLMHEFVHNVDNGTILASYGYATSSFYQEEQADTAKKWDSYASTSASEFIACGFQWIVQDQGGTARDTIYAKHPSFYLFMVNHYIPGFYQYQE